VCGAAPGMVAVRLVEPETPELGDAEVHDRQRAQVLAQRELCRVRILGGGQQPLRLLGHRREVPAPPGAALTVSWSPDCVPS
jgi:hypothetical protein